MLAVTGIGMVSALGLDAVTSCAAARAGIRRIVETDDLYVPDLEGEESAPVAVHRVPYVSAGFFGFARLMRLGIAGLDDLLRNQPSLAQSRLGMILVVDGCGYHEAWSRLAREQHEADPEEIEAGVADARAVRDQVVRDLLAKLVQETELPVDPQLRSTLASTAVGFVAALKQADDWLREGRCDRCIVGGIDCLIEPGTLAVLDGLRLLKAEDRPVGMIPGEAAAFVIIEKATTARSRRDSIQVLLEAYATGRDLAHPLISPAEAEPNESGVSVSIARTTEQLADAGAATGVHVVNLNGDSHRATEWARGLLSGPEASRWGRIAEWYPPLFFGEIGAATGTCSVALLARGWARRYAPSSNALVCLMDDHGGRGTFYARDPRGAKP